MGLLKLIRNNFPPFLQFRLGFRPLFASLSPFEKQCPKFSALQPARGISSNVSNLKGQELLKSPTVSNKGSSPGPARKAIRPLQIDEPHALEVQV